MRFALDQKWEIAVTFIMIAAFLDAMDGRLARMLNATSNFGAQLDSLSDFVCFGLSPSFVLYLWGLYTIPIKRVAWAFVLFYIVCSAIRLARFNATIDDETPDWKAHFFTGIPSTAAGVLVLTPMMLSFEYPELSWVQNHWFLGIYMAIIAWMMASRIPTFSVKQVTIRTEFASLVLVLVGALAASILLDPWATIPVLACLYLSLIPCSIFSYFRLARKHQK
jgi:CDP-diacylglycerol--serine O-phosphatidyltransferase